MHLVQQLGERGGVGMQQMPGQLELGRHGHQLLLSAVVEVTLDPLAGIVGGRGQAGPRGRQLNGSRPQGGIGGLQRMVEPSGVQEHPEAPGGIPQERIIGVGERWRRRATLHHHQSTERAREARWRHAKQGVAPPV